VRTRPRGPGLRSRLMLLVVSGTGTALVLGATIMIQTVTLSIRHSLDDGARRAVDEVIDMIEADRLPDPIPAAGSHLIQVVDTSNRVVVGSSGADRLVAVLEPDELRSAVRGAVLWLDGDRVGLDEPVRALAEPCRALRWSGVNEDLTVVVVTPAGEIARSTGVLRRVSLVVLPLVLALVGALAWRMITLTLQPVETLRAGAEEITGTRGAGRLPLPRTQDEIHSLALTLNGMLDRLERARLQQRAFVGDAAHELRSPLASIRTQLEVSQHLVERARSAEPAEGDRSTGADGCPPQDDLWEQLVPDLLAETVRLSRLVDDLLLLARADDAGAACLRPEQIDANTLIEQVLHQYDAARVPVTRAAPQDDDLMLEADPDALRRILRNLVDNAVRHARTSVTVNTHRRDAEIVLEIRDDGPGIPEQDRPRAFDRFTRFDEARARDEGGCGLGLAIVAELVRLHHGRTALDDAHPGLLATVHLPAAARTTISPLGGGGANCM
jgi:signal transduction histidine kinase